MKKEDIHWADWHRILIGSAPTEFLLEVLLRTIVLYFFLLIILKLMGKRMGGQLSIAELAVMLTLGAIICVPMQIPDRGILQGFLVLTCALAFQRWFNLIGFNFTWAEKIIQGKESMLLKDGVLNVTALGRSNISRQQLYAVLRSQNINNLGEVERIYLEACGIFSVYKFKEAKPGLSLFPTKDSAVHQIQKTANDILVCRDCGETVKANNSENCHNCGCETWEKAIL